MEYNHRVVQELNACSVRQLTCALRVLKLLPTADGTEVFVNELAIYDPQSRASLAVAPLLEARGDAGLVALTGDRLLLVGGRTMQGGVATVRTTTPGRQACHLCCKAHVPCAQ